MENKQWKHAVLRISSITGIACLQKDADTHTYLHFIGKEKASWKVREFGKQTFKSLETERFLQGAKPANLAPFEFPTSWPTWM